VAVLNLFRDRNFLGGEVVVNGDVPDLRTFGFDDVISSVIVVGGTFTLFTDKNFKGSSVTVSIHGGPGSDGRYPTPDFLGGREDTFSSVKVNSELG
jgi:hypothetical protein